MSYPVLLHLQGQRVVVIGGGQVASRKIGDLLDAGAAVTVVSPTLTDTLMTFVQTAQIVWYEQRYAYGLLAQFSPLLVFAATDSFEVNAQVIREAHDRGILVCSVQDPAHSDFSSMAAVRRGDIILAVATRGASPALSAHLRGRLEALIGEEYSVLAGWLADLRPAVLNSLASAQSRQALWQAILASPVLEHLKQGDTAAAQNVINRLLNDVGVHQVRI